ncbi:hypothetical protein PGTUg99_031215 [Puccinia graminis f. sp. tritici]|uniref:Uncharacterized protein n=1 Tax=Puccinia graminis f. sp. tritici TaxID=56615 RepID=A0A5B0RN99_PUCGR|nr:hypothetical protein PGTUg99_031215 [Puccinia graminis f. sp. tritici]
MPWSMVVIHQDPHWWVLVGGGLRVGRCVTNVGNVPTWSRPSRISFCGTIDKKNTRFVEPTTKLDLPNIYRADLVDSTYRL